MSKYVLALILMKYIQYSNISSGQYAGVSQYIKTCYITLLVITVHSEAQSPELGVRV